MNAQGILMKLANSLAAAIVVFAVQPAWATFHFMQIEQVIGGVEGDTSVQAIQLRMRSSLQNSVGASRIRAWDAAGANPVVVIDFASAVTNHGQGVRVLIASTNFAASTTPAAVPDFIMSNLIPASYLAAGSLTFETDAGGIFWRLSWGGAGYTGPTTGLTTNTAGLTGEFGKFDGPLPSAGSQALLYQRGAGTRSQNNATDYALTPGLAVFTNNADDSFTVAPCLGDLDGDREVSLADLAIMLSNFGTASGASYGDGDLDGDGDVELSDLAVMLSAFGTICS